jgi:hypothetical protein
MKKSLLNVTTLMRSGRIFDLSKTHSVLITHSLKNKYHAKFNYQKVTKS